MKTEQDFTEAVRGFTELTAEQAMPFLRKVGAAIRKEHVEVRGKMVSPFSTLRKETIQSAWRNRRSVLAFNAEDEVIGHICVEHVTKHWYEIRGTWVRPDYRGTPGNSSYHVGFRLYHAIIAKYPEESLFETSVTHAAWKAGARARMVPIHFPDLPEDVWKRTCHCPITRTGVHPAHNVPACEIRDHECVARVTWATWKRMGMPTPLDIADKKKGGPSFLLRPLINRIRMLTDDVRIVLS